MQAAGAEEHAGPADIVLVEDDTAYARLLCEHFGNRGLSVITTAYAEQAVDLVRRVSPQVILTDLRLAGRRDGWDLLLALKKDPAVQSIPVLIISSSEEVNMRGLALGGAEFCAKPISPAWLRQAVQQRLPSLAGKKVLVADDDPDFRHQVVRTLTRMEKNLLVEEAATGQDALARIVQSMPDLLLLDVLLPDLNGFEVLRQLRAHKHALNMPVLVVTGKELLPSEKADITANLSSLLNEKETNIHTLVQTVMHFCHRPRR